MKSSMLVLAVLALVATAFGGVQFSRTISDVGAGDGGSAVLSAGCTSTDKYGSNNCDLSWGSTYGVKYNVTLGKDITAGSTFSVDVKVDNIFPLKFDCPLCGGKCDFKILGHDISFDLPDCPIKAVNLHNSTKFTLPSKAPAIKAHLTGTVEAFDASKASIVKADVTAALASDTATGVYANTDAKFVGMVLADFVKAFLGA